MPFPIEEKLVVAVASSALFRLDEADEIFRSQGLAAYRRYQREHENTVLAPGIAFPFIRRFLKFNELFPVRMSWLASITDSMDMNLCKLCEMVKDREAWHAACSPWGHQESDMT